MILFQLGISLSGDSFEQVIAISSESATVDAVVHVLSMYLGSHCMSNFGFKAVSLSVHGFLVIISVRDTSYWDCIGDRLGTLNYRVYSFGSFSIDTLHISRGT